MPILNLLFPFHQISVFPLPDGYILLTQCHVLCILKLPRSILGTGLKGSQVLGDGKRHLLQNLEGTAPQRTKY